MLPVPATPTNIETAAAHLRAGRLVAFPTETVYGLGADATNGLAVAGLFEAKGRPRFNPLIVHVPDLAAAESLVVIDAAARRLAAAFWPGPLTLVGRRRAPTPIADLVTAGLDSLAVRVPAHPVAQALLRATGRPIAAPSANRSGHVSPTTARHVADDLGELVAMILDGGAAPLGLESTVIETGDGAAVLLRSGALTREEIEGVLGARLGDPGEDDGQRPASPGRLASHYAPRARLRLDAHDVRPGEALIAFGPSPPQSTGRVINLSARGDLREAAARLFSALRELDAEQPATIAVMPIPDSGLGEAINDRLRRAAAPRSE